MRAALYLRISQDRTGERAGVDRQEEDCRELAEQLGWDIAETFVDNDRSATTGKPRPAFTRMLEQIQAGRIGAVIAWHTDRLYRKLADLESIIPLFEEHKVLVRTCRAGELDLSTPTGRMLARILGSVAAHEGEQKSDRWKRSYRQRREAGEVYRSGPRHFGYERTGEIRPDEADVLRWIAAQITAGTSVYRVALELKERGVTTTLGNDWRAESLRNMLRSPRLAGLVVMNGDVIGDGDWEPIWDRATWETVRAAIDPKRPGKPASPRMALLSGIAFCGRPGCGLRLYRSATKHRPTYTCRQNPHQSNGHLAVMAAPVEEMVEAAARAALADPKVRESLAARLAGDGAQNIADQIDRIEHQLADLDAELRLAGGSRSASSIRRAIDDLDGQLDGLRGRLASVGPASLPVGDDWPTDVDRRAALIRVVIDRVFVDPPRKRGARFDPNRIRIIPVASDGHDGD